MRSLSEIEAHCSESQRRSLQRRYHAARWRRRFDVIRGAFVALLLAVIAVSVIAALVITTIYLLRYYT